MYILMLLEAFLS